MHLSTFAEKVCSIIHVMPTPMLKKPNKEELGVAVVKGAAGAIPIAGPIIAELLGAVIVDKRRQRLEDTLAALSLKVSALEDSEVQRRLENPESLDLLEEGLHQAARALSEDRKLRIASIVGNALLDEALSRIEQKRLLSILGDLNDIELKILFWHAMHHVPTRIEYARNHPEVEGNLKGFVMPELAQRIAVHESYVAHLVQLRLLEPQYESQPQLSLRDLSREAIRPPRVTGHGITPLGEMLLEQADLVANEA